MEFEDFEDGTFSIEFTDEDLNFYKWETQMQHHLNKHSPETARMDRLLVREILEGEL